MVQLAPLKIKGHTIKFPVIQGGMGIGVSLGPLVGAVGKEGGLGVISTAAIDRIISKRLGKKMTTYEAVFYEVTFAKAAGGRVAVNIMEALYKDRDEAVRGALDAKVDVIIAGAGLHLNLPSVAPVGDTALVPIVSSARALELICKYWQRQKYRPDAVILEGPLAGGHLGFKIEDVNKEENRLERLFPQVKEIADKYGKFPVIVAGGIYTRQDITTFLAKGADGVQMGTRFLATEESSATQAYKEAVVSATQEDIMVANIPGSPCGFPFRVINKSPMFLATLNGQRASICDKGYVLQKDKGGNYTICPAKTDSDHYFCICNGLLSSAGYNPNKEDALYTVGTNAWRVDKILTVHQLMNELKGITD
ncbi:MAG: 2-nitropropane dioxygenase [uncultured bacterium]|nr:MAG: 2-nitropropane dioxygenase [uncultured bacterium]